MIRKFLTVTNENGIHARPSMAIVQLCARYLSDITLVHTVENPSFMANAKSILNVMALGAECGAKIDVMVDGTDEVEAMAALEKLFAEKFQDHG
jgi:phosphocarrier protein HPr